MLVLLQRRTPPPKSPLSPLPAANSSSRCVSIGWLQRFTTCSRISRPGFAVEVFSAHKQRSWSARTLRDATTGDEVANASFPNVIKPKKLPLKQRALAGPGDDLRSLCCFFPFPTCSVPPWLEQEGYRRGWGGTSLPDTAFGGWRSLAESCCPLASYRPHAASDLIPGISAVFLKNRSKLWPRKSHRKQLGLARSLAPPAHASAQG